MNTPHVALRDLRTTRDETCLHCRRGICVGVGCTVSTIDDFADGIERKRIPCGERRRGYCRECGAPSRGFHHPGCAVERCPRCNGPSVSCGCRLPAGVS